MPGLGVEEVYDVAGVGDAGGVGGADDRDNTCAAVPH